MLYTILWQVFFTNSLLKAATTFLTPCTIQSHLLSENYESRVPLARDDRYSPTGKHKKVIRVLSLPSSSQRTTASVQKKNREEQRRIDRSHANALTNRSKRDRTVSLLQSRSLSGEKEILVDRSKKGCCLFKRAEEHLQPRGPPSGRPSGAHARAPAVAHARP